jgi:very-short-patch-repair endonuclease
MDENNGNTKPRWLTANKDFYRKFKHDRNNLKSNMTNAELVLWGYLRNNKQGVKFRRQHIIDFYIPDFVALSIKLIIEVDGKIHLRKRKEDAERTKRLAVIGYKVIRFENEEVENEVEKVLSRIRKEIKELTSTKLSEGEE